MILRFFYGGAVGTNPQACGRSVEHAMKQPHLAVGTNPQACGRCVTQPHRMPPTGDSKGKGMKDISSAPQPCERLLFFEACLVSVLPI